MIFSMQDFLEVRNGQIKIVYHGLLRLSPLPPHALVVMCGQIARSSYGILSNWQRPKLHTHARGRKRP